MATLHTATFPGPLGPLRAVDHGQGLSGLYFVEHRHAPSLDGAVEDVARFAATQRWLARYLAGQDIADELTVDLRGTDLQVAVWEELRRVPAGAVTTYGEVARRLGRPSAVRAVANAVGRNPVSIVVPCHRVIGADGTLTGYAGGLQRKRWLLRHEGAPIAATVDR